MPRRRPTPTEIARHADYLEGGTTFASTLDPMATSFVAVFQDQEGTVCDVFQIANCHSPLEARHRAWAAMCEILGHCSGSNGRTIPLGSAPTDQFGCMIFTSLQEA